MRRGFKQVRMLAAAGVLAMAAQFTSAQVMKQVPSSAAVVVKVANLQETSNKVASLAKKLGIAQFVPQLQDPMKALEQKLHSPKGINKSGELAFVYIDPKVAGVEEGKSMLVLVPVSTFEEFVSNLQESKVEGEVTEGTLPDNGEKVYVAHWGDYAAVSPAKQLVATKPEKALEMKGVAGKEVEQRDLVAYVNFGQLRAAALQGLQEHRQELLDGMSRAMEQAAAKKAQDPAAAKQAPLVAKTVMNQVLNLAQQVIQDTEAVSWGLSLSDDGIRGSLVAEFAPASYLGQLAATEKNVEGGLTAGLPKGTYLFYGGMSINPEHVTKVVDDLAQPVIKDLKAQGIDTTGIEKYASALKQMYGSSTGGAMGIVAPNGALGQEALFQSVAVFNGNADHMGDAIREMTESQNDFMKLFGQAEGQTKTTITTNAKTMGGVAFDRVQTQFNFAGNTPQEMQIQQMMNFLYGPEGMNMYAGKVDEKHLLVVSGVNEEVTGKAIAAAKSGEDSLGALEQVKSVDAQLPSKRMMAFYLPIDNLVTTGLSYARQFGLPVNVQMPPNLPPIGMTVSSEQSAYRLDGYVPAPLVQSLISAGLQAYMAVNGGGVAPGAQPNNGGL